MTRREEHVQERLQLFCKVAEETGSYEDAMWAVLRQEEEERQRDLRKTVDERAKHIVAAVCKIAGVKHRQLMKRDRGTRLVAEARWIAMRALRDEGYSLPTIGAALRRHHTSVMYGLAVVARNPDLIQRSREVRDDGTGLGTGGMRTEWTV